MKEEERKIDEAIEPGSVAAFDLTKEDEGEDLATVLIEAYNDGTADVSWEDCEVIYIMGEGERFEIAGVPAAGNALEYIKPFEDRFGVGGVVSPLRVSFENDKSIAMVTAYENVQGDRIERFGLEVNKCNVLQRTNCNKLGSIGFYCRSTFSFF